MTRQFTAEEIAEAKWASIRAISIRNMARAIERVRSQLTEAQVLERVPAEEKERFERGISLLKSGAYRP